MCGSAPRPAGAAGGVAGLRHRAGGAEAGDEGLGLVGTGGGTHQEPHLALLVGGELAAHLDGDAGVETRSGPAGQAGSGHGHGRGEGAAVADEFGPVTGEGTHGFAGVEHRDAAGEVGVVGVVGQHRAALAVVLGDDVHAEAALQIAQHQFAVVGRAQAPVAVGAVAERQAHQLGRGVVDHGDGEQRLDALVEMLER